MNLRIAVIAALTTSAVLAAAAPSAHAGSYTVESCRDRNGTPGLAVGDSTYGWHGSANQTGEIANECHRDYGAARMFLGVTKLYPTGYGYGATWQFDAPPGTTIHAYDLWWAGGVSPGGTAWLMPYNTPRYDNAGFGNQSNFASPSNHVARAGIDIGRVSLHVACNIANGCPSTGVDEDLVYGSIYRSAVHLADGTDPLADVAADAAMRKETWTGTVPLRFDATDSGGGVYRVLVDVDGARVATRSADPDNTRCRALYEDAPHAFEYPRPCSSTKAVNVAYDTTGLADGAHQVVVRLQDAAANTNEVLRATRTIDNVAPIIGAIGLSGTPRVGDDLTCAATVDGQSPTVGHAWLRSAADGSAMTQIAGANAATYRITEADQGRKLICRVTASDAGGSSARESSITQAPFDNGGVVAGYCSGRPTGAQDPCGDRDADGIPNRDDSSPDGATTGSDVPAGSTPTTTIVTGPSTSTVTTTKESTIRENERTTVLERGAANGEGASDDARITAFFDPSNRALATQPFGRRAVIAGKLTDGRGAAINGARIEVAARTALAGAAFVDQPSVATRSDGTFTLVVPRNVSSRRITLRYRAHVRDERAATEASVDLRVRAGVSLSITPKTSRNRGTIRFRGLLLGKPVPVRGKLVELQARAKGTKRWITFRTLRAARSGRFTARYTFRATFGAITYEFRARARQEGAYPYLTGASRAVRVRVRAR